MPPERVREIVAMEDRPVLRNLHITHAYHLLSEDLADVVGQDDASWCTFATWASKAAGFFVREETLKAELRRFLLAKDRLRDRLRELDRVLLGCDPLARICDPDDLGPALETSAEAALHVRTGNLVVFEELGALFAGFVQACRRDPRPGSPAFHQLLDSLTPGESRPDSVERVRRPDGTEVLVGRLQGGQDQLRDALSCYDRARYEKDAKRKAELLLLGSASAGLHEQIRLQPYIQGGLDAPVAEVFYSRSNDALAERVAAALLGEAQRLLHQCFAPVGEELGECVREFSSRHMMEMAVPGETLRMGCDLPAPKGRPLFDALLAEIDDGDLRSILERFGAYRAAEPHDAVGRLRGALARVLVFLRLHRPTFAGSAAADWADLDQRMRYIFCYFRSRQRIDNLRRAPFTRRQVSALLAGRMPAGAL